MTVRDEAAAIAGEIAGLRQAIHREPEIGLDLPKTQRKVLDALDGLPLEVSTGTALTSVTAVLRGARAGQLCCSGSTAGYNDGLRRPAGRA
jgi:hippurate hydrolase